MLDLNEMAKMTEEERKAAIDAHAEQTVAAVKKKPAPKGSVGGSMVLAMILAMAATEQQTPRYWP